MMVCNSTKKSTHMGHIFYTPLRAPQRVSRDFPFVNHCGLSPIKIDPHGVLFPICTPLRAPIFSFDAVDSEKSLATLFLEKLALSPEQPNRTFSFHKSIRDGYRNETGHTFDIKEYIKMKSTAIKQKQTKFQSISTLP